MSRREDEKRKSLGALFRIAEEAKAPILTPAPKSAPPPPAPAPRPKPRPVPAPAPAPAAPDVHRAKQRQLEERKAKLEEERALKTRRQRELARNANLEWRGMDHMGVPTGVRRTAFDRVEPNVSQKIQDVLGEAKEKESRAKNREKGRRQGGR